MSNQGAAEDDPFAQYSDVAAQYYTIESRIAWDWLCGGNRHFAYYETGTWWPFPISAGQRRMQDMFLTSLAPAPGAHLLDAGCGDGHVAIDLALRRPDVHITAFDIVERHVANARRNVAAAGLAERVDIRRLDFARISSLPPASYHAAYTSEALLHAPDPDVVLQQLARVLRPAGVLVLHEYHNDFMGLEGFPAAIARDRPQGTDAQREPAFVRAKRYFEVAMARAGFGEVVVADYSANVEPMARLLSVSAWWRVVVLALGLQRFFPNSAKREEGYVGRERWAYVSVRGVKGERVKGDHDEEGEGAVDMH